MSEVNWKPSYSIDVKNISGADAHYLKHALTKYRDKHPTQTPDVFSKIMIACDDIMRADNL